MRKHNIFLELGKYVERQNENLLTQSLAALFNQGPIFRADLINLFRRKSDRKEPVMTGECQAITQSSQYLKNCRILVDMEIRFADERSPRYVIEAKLTAPLTPNQAQHYAEYVKRRRGKSQLVMVTVAGIDSKLKAKLRNTLWLSWTEIAELAVRPAHRGVTERLLCVQFYEMLKERGIPMVPRVTSGEYKKLRLVNKFVESNHTKSLHIDTIDVINNIMARMREFANTSWGSLTAAGYKPYTRLYVHRPSKNNEAESPYAEIEAGFSQWKKRNNVYGRYIWLNLDCMSMKLSVWVGWSVGKRHHAYEADSNFRSLKEWTQRDSRRLFKKPLDDAQRNIQTQLEKYLKRFKNSRYYKS